jgi:hypothetical protein
LRGERKLRHKAFKDNSAVVPRRDFVEDEWIGMKSSSPRERLNLRAELCSTNNDLPGSLVTSLQGAQTIQHGRAIARHRGEKMKLPEPIVPLITIPIAAAALRRRRTAK